MRATDNAIGPTTETIITKSFFPNFLVIGGGVYWAGWTAARPLFGSCGPPLSLTRPLFLGDVNFFFLLLPL